MATGLYGLVGAGAMVVFDILFQGPNPFATPTPISFDPLTAAGGGGISNGTLIGLAGGALIAIIPIFKSWVDNRANMATQTTQTTLASHTTMLKFALEENKELKDKIESLQLQLDELLPRLARLEAQLDDKKAELVQVTHERDELKRENADLKATIAQMEFAARGNSGWKPSKFETEAKT